MQKSHSMILLYTMVLAMHAVVLQADRINHYGPAREIFVYALDSFVKHRSPQGIEKMTEQMLTLRKKDGTINLDGRTSDHIRYVHERYRKENDEDAVCFMAPFLFASGRSFIHNLGQSRESYEWATKKTKEPSASYIAMRRSQMEDAQWDMNAALRGRRIITQDIIFIKLNYLKESFPYLQKEIQAKILEEAEASFSADCTSKSMPSYYSQCPCEDFYEKLIIMREAHKDFKEKHAAEQGIEGSGAVPVEAGVTSDSVSVSSESTSQSNG